MAPRKRHPTNRERLERYLQKTANHAKKKSKVASERDEKKRATFQEQIALIDPHRLVYMDEAGFNLAMYLAYGWSPKGVRLVESVPFQRGKNFSVLGALSLSGMVSTFSKEGSIRRVDFESFLENDLLPLLAPDSVLVLDNARSHHGGRIAQIVESFGCSVLYLPPYSPDYNPIELAWSWIKSFVRGLAPRDMVSRLEAIQLAIASLPSEFGESWFRKVGVLK